MTPYELRQRTNRVMWGLTSVALSISLITLFSILGYIFFKGISSLDIDFFTKLPKPVGETGGGIVNSIIGSLKVVGLASVISIPVGIIGAIYLSEFGNSKWSMVIRYAADVLNGVPSIVIGIFTYTLIVLPMGHFSAFAGSIALALIAIPYVLRTSEEFIRLVPNNIREAGLALGVPQWKVIVKIVLPTASRGILTAAILSISRVAGETAPLIFTAFGNRFWSDGYNNPIATLPHTLFTYAVSPYKDWHNQAWASALVLMVFVLIGNIGARLIIRPRNQGTAQ